MKPIEIVYTIDDNFVQQCYVSIKSIARHTADNLLVHVISNGEIAADNQRELRTLESEHLHIDFTRFDEKLFHDFPVGETTGNANIPYTSYFRLYLCRHFTADKMIYVDADTLFLADIATLWNCDLGNHLVAGVPDLDSTQNMRRKDLEIADGEHYINAGLLLMNLKELRERHFYEEALALAHEHPEKIYLHDQDIVNYLCRGQIVYLPYRWNMISDFLRKKPRCTPEELPKLREGQREPAMIHFAGGKKPWEGGCRNPFQS
jgi:lipopolysaccharide biosynthesis glycosyltransferase